MSTDLTIGMAAGAPDRLTGAGVLPAELVAVPLEALARQGGSEEPRNAGVLGLVAGWCGLNGQSVRAAFRRKLAKRGHDLVEGRRGPSRPV